MVESHRMAAGPDGIISGRVAPVFAQDVVRDRNTGLESVFSELIAHKEKGTGVRRGS